MSLAKRSPLGRGHDPCPGRMPWTSPKDCCQQSNDPHESPVASSTSITVTARYDCVCWSHFTQLNARFIIIHNNGLPGLAINTTTKWTSFNKCGWSGLKTDFMHKVNDLSYYHSCIQWPTRKLLHETWSSTYVFWRSYEGSNILLHRWSGLSYLK